ncbi:HAD-IB family phosphatase [Francisellaceae bacterium]|nr:HAD-IB family phosphatase [Francisellaceae bacterium]
MSKGTVIFDFDSTIIQIESLEEILADKLKNNPAGMDEIKSLTNLGMNGDILFQDSLSQRLAIAAPNLDDLTGFYTQHQFNIITNGLPELILWLQKNDIEVFIISGGLYESILPYATALNIKSSFVHAVKLSWDTKGKYLGMNPKDPFSISKLNGAKLIAEEWQKPSIIVGDGFTDYQLYESGLTTNFIAYTEHQSRDKVVKLADYIARDCIELKKHIKKMIST